MYTIDGFGATKIAHILNKEGLKTKRNCNWSQNAIIRILNNSIYTGKVVNRKQEVINFLEGIREDKDENEWLIVEKPEIQIIEDDVFKKAQELLEERHNTFKITGERNSSKHLFSKLIKCAHCGYSFRREKRQFKNTYIRWTCCYRNVHGADTCPNRVRVDEVELIDSLNSFFRDVFNSKDYLKYVVDEFKKIYESKNETLLDEKELQERLKKLEQDKEKELDLYREGIVDKNYMLGKVKPINEAIENSNKQLEMIREEITVSDKLEDVLEKTFKNLDEMVDVGNMTNQMLKEIISKIEVDKDGNTVISLKLIEELGIDDAVSIFFKEGKEIAHFNDVLP